MNNKHTPATIGEQGFSIPLYQRLFEWTETEIKQLLNDLYGSFKLDKNNPKPYYIGMLTVHNGSLVDGQQRFTVLNLIGIAFETENWKQFVKIDDLNYRLKFFARKKDADYIERILTNGINNENHKNCYVNRKMENGIITIKKFVDSIDENLKESFKNYVYNNATFFISELPNEYNSQDLNRYFEAMNASGKGLENHEILKVDLLKKLTKDKVFEYTKMWNAVSEMDKCLIRPFNKDETTEIFRIRVQKTLSQLYNFQEIIKECKDIKINEANNESTENHPSIRDIVSSSKRPNISYNTRSERSILNFTEFLLQILWLQLSEEDRNKTTNFFNTYKLQETFKKYLKDDDVEMFFNNLLKYRVLFDNFIVRIRNNDGNDNSYFINFNEENIDNEISKQLIQYQSMLYVSTSSYLWLTKLLKYVKEKPSELSAEKFITKIKEYDNERWIGRFSNNNLTYGYIDRYWFWRLDYYLWEKRSEFFKNESESLKIADKYLFKSNRSIEHISPQTPQSNSEVKLDEISLNCFGNLAMISSGQNSSLQNESFEVKRAHVQSFIIQSKNGSIESLKMLKGYEYAAWNIVNIKKHEKEMIKILEESFIVSIKE